MSVNEKMTAIANAIRAKTGGTEPLSLDQMAIAIAGLSGGGADINAKIAASLPSEVTDGQIVIVSSTAAENIYFGYTAPDTPAEGDVWIHTIDTAAGYVFPVGTIVLKPGATMQYSGSLWVYRDAYIGVSGAWKLFSTLSPLSSLSWAQISGIANTGEDLSLFFGVGDVKSISIGSTAYDVEIVGFNHDDLADGSGKAGITFGLKDCLATTYTMNSSATNSGGWGSCALRTTLRGTIWNQLPSDLRAVIKEVTKKASAGSASSTINSYTDTLFLFAEKEIFGSTSYSVNGEGTQYARFTTSSTRVKKVNGSAAIWWLRSPRSGRSDYFCCVSSGGTADNTIASGSCGVAFGFCV